MTRVSRRRTIGAALGIGALAATGFGVTRLLRISLRRHPSTPYDDLLSQLDDRDLAAKVGRAFLPQLHPKSAQALAAELRSRIGHASLNDVTARDSEQGALVETNGWVLPETLARLCALAALVTDHHQG